MESWSRYDKVQRSASRNIIQVQCDSVLVSPLLSWHVNEPKVSYNLDRLESLHFKEKKK